jgi:aquaporin related protein
MEIILTMQLVLVVFMVGVEKHKSTFLAPLVIGISVFVSHLVGIKISGASLNPARSFGPALITLEFADHWIYCRRPCSQG